MPNGTGTAPSSAIGNVRRRWIAENSRIAAGSKNRDGRAFITQARRGCSAFAEHDGVGVSGVQASKQPKIAAADIELTTGSSAAPVREMTLEESLGAQIRLLRRRGDLTGAELSASAGI